MVKIEDLARTAAPAGRPGGGGRNTRRLRSGAGPVVAGALWGRNKSACWSICPRIMTTKGSRTAGAEVHQMSEKWMPVAEAAQCLRRSRRTLYRWIASGRVPSRVGTNGRRQVLIGMPPADWPGASAYVSIAHRSIPAPSAMWVLSVFAPLPGAQLQRLFGGAPWRPLVTAGPTWGVGEGRACVSSSIGRSSECSPWP